MHRHVLLNLLHSYQPREADDRLAKTRMLQFIEHNPRCFERSHQIGHFTASSWILDPSSQKVLLHFHRKLQMWLQPGGHADGQPDLLRVSKQEAMEETGLKDLELLSAGIFDLDIHRIPVHEGDAEHDHYDVRFVYLADSLSPLEQSSESLDLKWFNEEDFLALNPERSLMRMFEKTLEKYFSKEPNALQRHCL